MKYVISILIAISSAPALACGGGGGGGTPGMCKFAAYQSPTQPEIEFLYFNSNGEVTYKVNGFIQRAYPEDLSSLLLDKIEDSYRSQATSI